MSDADTTETDDDEVQWRGLKRNVHYMRSLMPAQQRARMEQRNRYRAQHVIDLTVSTVVDLTIGDADTPVELPNEAEHGSIANPVELRESSQEESDGIAEGVTHRVEHTSVSSPPSSGGVRSHRRRRPRSSEDQDGAGHSAAGSNGHPRRVRRRTNYVGNGERHGRGRGQGLLSDILAEAEAMAEASGARIRRQGHGRGRG